MLGRQQIAGGPTAIHELFKNAHDAYAGQIVVDYFRSDALMAIRDTGMGMTTTEFEQRWLTIGTDSKLAGGTLPPLPIPLGAKPRPVLGEKGIGRLAIAVLGPLVLVLTRSPASPAGKEITSALIHWGFFEIPGLDLDRIEIPVLPLGREESPGSTLVGLLKQAVIDNADQIASEAPPEVLEQIRRDVEAFDLDLPALYDELGGPRLDGVDDRGTHFFVLPADRIIERDIDGTDQNTATNLTKFLLGFANTMVPGAPKPLIEARFTDHRLDGTFEELIEGRSFFTPAEFESADHHVKGRFDEFGRFAGTVKVFGGAPVDYVFAYPAANGRVVECGPFELDFAHVQGAARDSRLDKDAWADLVRKTSLYGGLYVYRDGIRVLPYGNTDNDFLDIEKRRNLGMSYYFFSHRRMFGAIGITRAMNSGLVEKAGREGFQQNRAFRQFKQILESFLVNLAAEFFREGGVYSDVHEQERRHINRNNEVRAQREKQVGARRRALAVELERFFERTNRNEPAERAAALSVDVERRVGAAATGRDPEANAAELLRVELDVRSRIQDMRGDYAVTKPKALGLTKGLARDWATYQVQADRLEKEVFAPVGVDLGRLVGDAVARHGVPLDKRRRVHEAIRVSTEHAERRMSKSTRDVREALHATQASVTSFIKSAEGALRTTVQDILSDFGSRNLSSEDEAGFQTYQTRLEDRLAQAVIKFTSLLDGTRARLEGVADAGVEGAISVDELTEALEEKTHALQEEMELYIELAQLGMAVSVLQHDFADAANSIRNGIRALRPWGQANPKLEEIRDGLRIAFEHLDSYLTLFTPLNRRLYRSRIQIQGSNVAKFLSGVFANRFKDAGIRLHVTDAFRRCEFEGYPSSFYPVFVNLVENARHWVEENRSDPGLITVDARNGELVVQDNGPGIPERDRDAVFEYGFTRKTRGGQGLGLYISRQVLGREGWKLELEPHVPGHGAIFRMIPPGNPTLGEKTK